MQLNGLTIGFLPRRLWIPRLKPEGIRVDHQVQYRRIPGEKAGPEFCYNTPQAPVAQRIEHRTSNPVVVGSNPARGAFPKNLLF
jgi:hypothetical protein